MSDCRITIVIPVYNTEMYLQECLNSVVNQTYKAYQVICVNDGSTDGSKAILDSYSQKHPNIVVIDKTHTNAGDARNEGLLNAEGDYCLFLDSDDVLELEALELVAENIEKNHPDIVVYGAFYFGENDIDGKCDMDWMLDERVIGEYEYITEREADPIMYSYTGCNPWNKVVRKGFIDDNHLRFQSINKSNDVYFIAMALALSKKTSFLRERLINYRIHNKGIQGSDNGLGNEYYDALFELKKGLEQYSKYDSLKKEFWKMALLHCVDKVFGAKTDSDMAVMVSGFEEKEQELEFYKLDRSELLNDDLLLKWDYIKSIAQYPHNCVWFKESLIAYQKKHNETLKTIEELNEANTLMKDYKSWDLPQEGLSTGDKVVVYGAGDVGNDLYSKLLAGKDYNLAGWVDKDYKKRNEEGKPVTSVDSIRGIEFDKVIIAINNAHVAESVANLLHEEYLISKAKIVRMHL